jgi:hypothetical protein
MDDEAKNVYMTLNNSAGAVVNIGSVVGQFQTSQGLR